MSWIGEQLRQARQARSLSIEQAAVTTRIRLRYLQALENDDVSIFPSLAQARGFLRTYAVYLGLPAEPLLAALDGEPLVEADGHGADGHGAMPADESQAATSEAADLAGTENAANGALAVIGQKLRRQRQLLGLSLDDIERQTHLRGHYLHALETGNLEGLPSPVQGRGMLKNYASFLGMDPEPLLLQFAGELQDRLSVRRQAAGRPRRLPPQSAAETGSAGRKSRQPTGAVRRNWLQRVFSTEFLMGSLVTLFLVLFVGWGALRISAARANLTPTVTAPSIANVLAPPPTQTPAVTPRATATPSSLPGEALEAVLIDTPETTDAVSANEVITPAGLGSAPIQVYVVVRQRAWLRATVDGEVSFEGRAVPGTAYPFPGDERVELLTGNAAGLQVFFNQTDLGTLGAYGEVAHLIFTLNGMQTPTATLTPTGQPTPTGTPTAPGEVETPAP